MNAMLRQLLALSVLVGFATAPTVGTLAQEQHGDHHPPTVAPAPPTQGGSMQSEGGMMGSDHMKMMQDMRAKMMGGSMAMPMGDNGPSSLALHGIAVRMQKEMAISFTGNTDADFAKLLIPHLKAGTDMAKTLLAFGKDPDIKKIAEQVLREQEVEIRTLEEWQRKQGR